MSRNASVPTIAPFAEGYRAAGVLLHVTSLPSRYGIGDLGPNAFAWIDRLWEAGQSWWQALPLGPTGYGNSPYQPLSSFAGNWLLISPDELIEDGLLQPRDCEGVAFPDTTVDYEAVVAFKCSLLATAWNKFRCGAHSALRMKYEQFCECQAHWLDDYALFSALKVKYGGADYLSWPAELIQRAPEAIACARREVALQIQEVRFAQFLLFQQGERIRAYARAKGVHLIGDLPFFVSPDSTDVWADPQLFRLDEQHRPRFMAGVPPDYFSAQGQLWGNPVYNWDAIGARGYRWFINRLRALLAHVDVIRLDHFRAFAAAWHVPEGAHTAEHGCWVPGPGANLFEAVRKDLGNLPFIAEDLGIITQDVTALRTQYQLPGMRVLQFAFDGDPQNPHLPHNYTHDTVVYTGTHDNNTTRGWFDSLPDNQRRNLWKYMGRTSGETQDTALALMQLAWSSSAALAIVPLQDVLNLGAEARMNVPGRSEGNWRWRCTQAQMGSESAFGHLKELTEASGRSSGSLCVSRESVLGAASLGKHS
jgi:4-alpha-glucanotransferase